MTDSANTSSTPSATPAPSSQSTDTSQVNSNAQGTESEEFSVNWNEVEEALEKEKQKEKKEYNKNSKQSSSSKASQSNSKEDSKEDEEKEGSDDKESETQDSDESNKVEEEPKERLLKVKVNGVEQEITEEEAVKAYELAIGAREKFNEAKKMRDEVQKKEADINNFIKQVKTPEGILSLIEFSNVDPKQVFRLLHSELTMPEDKKKLRDIERREAALKNKEEEKKKILEQKKAEREVTTWKQKYTQDISSELKKVSLEPNAHNIRLVSSILLDAQRANTSMTTSQAVTYLKTQVRKLQAQAQQAKEIEAKSKVNVAIKPVGKGSNSASNQNKKKIRPITDFGAANISQYYDQFTQDDE